MGTLAVKGRAVGHKQGEDFCTAGGRLTDLAGLAQEWRRTLAGVVTVQVQAGASVFARLGVALVPV